MQIHIVHSPFAISLSAVSTVSSLRWAEFLRKLHVNEIYLSFDNARENPGRFCKERGEL